MDSLLGMLGSLPAIALYALFGAIGGGLGGSIGTLLAKGKHSGKITAALVVIGTIIAIQFANMNVSELRKYAVTQKVIDQLKEQRLFSTIFRVHPESEGEVRTLIDQILATAPEQDVFLRAQTASAEFTAKYFDRHLVAAPASAIYKLVQRNAEVMHMLGKRPELCVGYFVGKPQFAKQDLETLLPEDFVESESNMKADVIQASIDTPTIQPPETEQEKLAGLLVHAYTEKGYALDNLATKLPIVETLPPEEGCNVATEFSDVLVSLGEQDATYVFKNLLYLSQQEAQQNATPEPAL